MKIPQVEQLPQPFTTKGKVKSVYENSMKNMMAYPGFLCVGGMRFNKGDTTNTISANPIPKYMVLSDLV